MEDLPINLKLDSDYPYGDVKNPVGPDNDPRYPVLHYEGDDDLDLPQDGEMTVKYHVKRETSEVDRKTGKHHYCCDIEILSIEKVKDEEVEAPARSGSEAADALDALMKKQDDDDDEEGEY